MEESSNKVLYIIVGIVAVLLVISFGFLIIRSALEKGNNLTTAVNDKMDNVLESQYTQYEAATISGSQVLNVISDVYSQTEPIEVIVKTNADTAGTKYCAAYTTGTGIVKDSSTTHSGKVATAKQKGNNKYITPTGKFLGSITRDTNDNIVTLTFTQQ